LRSSEITSLSDLLKQSSVEQQVLDSTISVPAGQRRAWPIIVDRNRMSNPELEGSFSSSGGVGGNIRVLVLNHNAIVYDSGRTTNGQVHVPLSAGVYQLVLDNGASAIFARSVTADFKLHYIR